MSETIARVPRAVRLIGVASGLGVPPVLAEASTRAAAALRAAGLCGAIERAGVACEWDPPVVLPATMLERPAAFAWLCQQIADRVVAAAVGDELPLVVGGDHGMAVGTWRGVARAQAMPIGMLWIDAHMDAHTSETSLSGNAHGMPLAALLGATPTPWPAQASCLDAARVCVFGVRSFEDAERRLLQRAGIKVVGDDEIRSRGLRPALADALAHVGRGGEAFGISIDLDVIDPDDAPGVNTPCAGGLNGAALLVELRGVGLGAQLVGLEIAEYNSDIDANGKTAALAAALLAALMMPGSNERP